MAFRRIFSSCVTVVLTAVVLPALFAPGAVHAQEEADEPVEMAWETVGYDEEQVEILAGMYLEITEVRDELHAEIARWHEAGRRRQARERADERLDEIHARTGISPGEYEAFIRLVSVDQVARNAFQEIVERLREGDS